MANDTQQNQEREGFEIDLVELLYRYLENARYLILAAVLGALIMALYTFLFVNPTYKATSKMYITNSKDSVINLSDLQMGSNLAGDYVEVFNTHDMHQEVLRRLQRAGVATKYRSAVQLQRMLSVSNRSGTRLIYITVTSEDPAEAAAIANMYLTVALEMIPQKIGTNGLDFEHAVVPVSPSAPNKVRNILIGFLFGLVLAAAVITVQFIVDDRVRNSEQLEKRLGLPVLGMMPATEGNAPTAGRSAGGSSGSKRARATKGGKK